MERSAGPTGLSVHKDLKGALSPVSIVDRHAAPGPCTRHLHPGVTTGHTPGDHTQSTVSATTPVACHLTVNTVFTACSVRHTCCLSPNSEHCVHGPVVSVTAPVAYHRTVNTMFTVL